MIDLFFFVQNIVHQFWSFLPVFASHLTFLNLSLLRRFFLLFFLRFECVDREISLGFCSVSVL